MVRTYTRGIDLLFLCTGNVCRSPMAEAFLRRHAARAGAADVRVHSMGLLESGRPVPAESQATMQGWGIDLSGYRSRQITEDAAGAADLIIGMARDHVREVAVLVPSAFARTFTLKELVRRGEEVGPRAHGQPVEEWVAKVHAGRVASEMVGVDRRDDVADPIGRPRRVYERTAQEIDALTDRVAALLWPPPPSSSGHADAAAGEAGA